MTQTYKYFQESFSIKNPLASKHMVNTHRMDLIILCKYQKVFQFGSLNNYIGLL